jgi:cell division septal protein FtsQ
MARKPTSTKKKKAGSDAPTWRSINQKGKLRSTSSSARERRVGRLLRWSALAAVVLILGGGVGYALYFSGTHLKVFTPGKEPVVLTEIDFASDGVLDSAWMEEHFPLDGETTALAFDVHALKRKLEAVGQIREATVAIALPDRVIVRVKEREPILRARVKQANGTVATILIAADGAVFEGIRFPRETLRHLPGLTGVSFQRTSTGYRPIAAMRTVSPLIQQARNEFPEIYGSWQWISLEELSADPDAPYALITVKSRRADRIVFAPRVFHRQLSKLKEVFIQTEQRHPRGYRTIDLSFSDQAIVEFRES